MKKTALALFSVIVLAACTKDKVAAVIPYPNATCSDTISFTNDLLPVIQEQCAGCHDPANGTPGGGYELTNYTNVKANISAVIGSMKSEGYQFMPQNNDPLPDTTIQKFMCWVNQGKLNN